MDTSSKAKNEEWLKALKKDVYIAETANVIDDWLTSSTKVVRMNANQ